MNDSKSQREQCCICGKDVSNGWFGRIREGEKWVKVCSPACSISYTDRSYPPEDEFKTAVPKLRFVVNGELWS
jgi:hypothetical protein